MALKKEEITSRESPEAMQKRMFEAKLTAMEKAMKGEKVRYKSNRDPERFLYFLESRLKIWEQIKDDTFHGKRMYEKTKEIVDSLT